MPTIKRVKLNLFPGDFWRYCSGRSSVHRGQRERWQGRLPLRRRRHRFAARRKKLVGNAETDPAAARLGNRSRPKSRPERNGRARSHVSRDCRTAGAAKLSNFSRREAAKKFATASGGNGATHSQHLRADPSSHDDNVNDGGQRLPGLELRP